MSAVRWFTIWRYHILQIPYFFVMFVFHNEMFTSNLPKFTNINGPFSDLKWVSLYLTYAFNWNIIDLLTRLFLIDLVIIISYISDRFKVQTRIVNLFSE